MRERGQACTNIKNELKYLRVLKQCLVLNYTHCFRQGSCSERGFAFRVAVIEMCRVGYVLSRFICSS